MDVHNSVAGILGAMGLSVLIVAVCVLVHYEALRLASIYMPKFTIRPRQRILLIMGVAFVAHSVEVWLVAVGFFIIAQFPSIGGISAVTGQFGGSFAEFLYYSTVSYTSLGIGDLYPTGALRLLTGVEALVGLAMIAWTGSFTYLAMEKFWSLHRTRTD
ncbi:MAG: hypothetical protein ACI82H_001538 [Alphaproteobacteria bacterium]|jgi:hypothetical protein